MGRHYHMDRTPNTFGFGKDEYETPTYALDMILNELDPSEWQIWEPFRGSGFSTEHMRKCGFEVTNGAHEDFFDHTEIPYINRAKKLAVVTNPPYSRKKDILYKLNDLKVDHLALFVPVGTISCEYFGDLFQQKKLQVIFHSGTCKFLHPTTHEPLGKAGFDLAWFSVGLDLQRDVQYKSR